MSVSIFLTGADLVPSIVQDLLAPGVTPSAAVGRALEAHLFERFQQGLGERLIKPPLIRNLGHSSEDCTTLPEFASSGHTAWYVEAHFATRTNERIEILNITTHQLNLIPIEYGQGVQRAVQMKIRPKKTQTNHEFRMNHVVVAPEVLGQVLTRFQQGNDLAQPLMANFAPGPQIHGFRTVGFDHMLTGRRVFCECARAAHTQWILEARKLAPRYVGGLMAA